MSKKDSDKLHIGLVDWLKPGQYGVVHDLETLEEVFIHRSENSRINELEVGKLIVFETRFDPRKKGLNAKSSYPLTAAELDILRVLSKSFKPKFKEFSGDKLFAAKKSNQIPKVIQFLIEKEELSIKGEFERKLEEGGNDWVIHFFSSGLYKYVEQEKIRLQMHSHVVQFFVQGQSNFPFEQFLLDSIPDWRNEILKDATQRLGQVENDSQYQESIALLKRFGIIAESYQGFGLNRSIAFAEEVVLRQLSELYLISSLEFRFLLLKEGLVKSLPHEDYIEFFFNFSEGNREKYFGGYSEIIKSKVIDSLLELVREEILRDDERRLKTLFGFLNQHHQILTKLQIEKLNNMLSPGFRLSLKLEFEDLYSNAEFLEDEHFFDLPEYLQARFLKRRFKDYHEGVLLYSKDTIKKWLKAISERLGKSPINPSVHFVVHILDTLGTGITKIEHEGLAKILASHFEVDAERDYQIEGFFNICPGRAVLKKDFSFGEEEASYSIELKNDSIPYGVVYCEGRKSKKLDSKSGFEFWWCRQKPCYNACQELTEHSAWQSYTLQDFLHTANLQYDSDSYFTFLSWLNKINDRLKHLKCRGCNRVLKPQNQSYWAFYRATRFHCSTDGCTEQGEVVYLNHCLSPSCKGLIDSRNSKQCPNGWYICPNDECSSCCSHLVFEERLENLQRVGAPIPDSLIHIVENELGHLEREIRYCYSCGDRLYGGRTGRWNTLNWLRNHCEGNVVLKCGQRSDDNKWWFLVRMSQERLNRIERMGFNVEPAKEEGTHFISELFRDQWELEKDAPFCENQDCRRNH